MREREREKYIYLCFIDALVIFQEMRFIIICLYFWRLL